MHNMHNMQSWWLQYAEYANPLCWCVTGTQAVTALAVTQNGTRWRHHVKTQDSCFRHDSTRPVASQVSGQLEGWSSKNELQWYPAAGSICHDWTWTSTRISAESTRPSSAWVLNLNLNLFSSPTRINKTEIELITVWSRSKDRRSDVWHCMSWPTVSYTYDIACHDLLCRLYDIVSHDLRCRKVLFRRFGRRTSYVMTYDVIWSHRMRYGRVWHTHCMFRILYAI